jgi:hypothetical protein
MANRRPTGTRVAIGIAVVIASLALIVWQLFERSRSEARVARTEQALAYACGYALGQHDALRNAGLTSTAPKDDTCKTYKDLAAEHGFTGTPTR